MKARSGTPCWQGWQGRQGPHQASVSVLGPLSFGSRQVRGWKGGPSGKIDNEDELTFGEPGFQPDWSEPRAQAPQAAPCCCLQSSLATASAATGQGCCETSHSGPPPHKALSPRVLRVPRWKPHCGGTCLGFGWPVLLDVSSWPSSLDMAKYWVHPQKDSRLYKKE